MEEIVDEVLISEKKLQARIKELGEKITTHYNQDDEIVMVCILRGGFLFMADLAREVKLPVVLDFMDVTSYEGGTTTTGDVRIIKDLEESIEHKHVLIAEDIIDTGLTLKHIIKVLETRNPKSINICTLLDKPERRTEKEVEVTWNGFEIPNKFVVGYGLDFQEKYRNIPYIFVPKPELYKK
ncbi:hypoxanthine phosphoribosyltransferase [Halobacteroides halobius DSM 5150]|uniref:Hypoxanthine phosphoribosyltransferase n=1 Tax=Halobacteroides halobius (strain ATCC 35273 / DSM 5150 / MD-1) TaxID=748449 RepID=L0K6Z9_HALHC|nr:hypoxanthine phosphoribosyltransferase [Halobacteroides halobius]AGB40149.1 hypoxanthine phosphoribosyltransferase [Halobacteroides halobius DSM 5150]